MKRERKIQFLEWGVILLFAVVLNIGMDISVYFFKKNINQQKFNMVELSINTELETAENDSEKVDAYSFCHFITGVDEYYNVFAAVYSLPDLSLQTVRSGDRTPDREVHLDPFLYPDLIQKFKTEIMGYYDIKFKVVYSDQKERIYATPLFYRHIDTDKGPMVVAMAIPFIPDTVELPPFFSNVIQLIFIVLVFRSAVFIANISKKRESIIFKGDLCGTIRTDISDGCK